MPGQATLREVVEALAPLERRAASDAERRAAEWIVERLRLAGVRARLEDTTFLASRRSAPRT